MTLVVSKFVKFKLVKALVLVLPNIYIMLTPVAVRPTPQLDRFKVVNFVALENILWKPQTFVTSQLLKSRLVKPVLLNIEVILMTLVVLKLVKFKLVKALVSRNIDPILTSVTIRPTPQSDRFKVVKLVAP
ncbi:hypothetical protein AMBR_MGDJBKAP_01617 [Leuconostoc pseudomesenteroides]|nr:hypothetical protein AMBR_MGDJBKAP_01617 [Leuconostoc pseudomesenteroides]